MNEGREPAKLGHAAKIFRAILPNSLKDLYDASGIAALLIFVFGFVTATAIAVGLFYSGKIPASLIPDSYKKSSVATEPANRPHDNSRVKPTVIEIHTLKQTADWINPIKNWLQAEGKKRKDEKLISDFITETIETQTLPVTSEFQWLLKASSDDYSIVGWAFKVSGDDHSPQLLPLQRTKSSDGRDSISFDVPKCEQGDRLIAIIRLSWEKELTPVDFLSTFRSTVN